MKAKLGPDHPNTLFALNNLAEGYRAAERYDEALPLFEESLKLQKAKLGPDHPATITSQHNLAAAYHAARRIDEALPLFEAALKLQRGKLGPDHTVTLVGLNNLARPTTTPAGLPTPCPSCARRRPSLSDIASNFGTPWTS